MRRFRILLSHSAATPPETEEPTTKKSKTDELNDFISSKAKGTSALSSTSEVLNQMRRDFASFDSTGERPPILDKIFKALKAIPPTSVEAERAFSAAGLFITKLRSRLNDKTIDDLCFLRGFFLAQKSQK